MDKTSIRAILVKNWIYLLILVTLSISVYLNSLGNSFAVVDDLQGIVENKSIGDFWGSLRHLRLQPILYAIWFNLYGLNPLPFRLFAVLNHAIVSGLIFLTLYQLTYKKAAMIAALLFAVHPVNSEAVVWISANFYIIQALFTFCCILLFIQYRKYNNIRYLYATAFVYLMYLVLIRNPFVLVTPFVILAIDCFILDRGFDLDLYKKLALFIGPGLIIFMIFVFPTAYKNRTDGQTPENGKLLVNEQALIPILEGYPYSLWSSARLYAFPKTLTVYYDGNPVTTTTKIAMFAFFCFYLSGLVYFYKKDKKVLGFLILPLILVAPVFSPIKVTWYITERYLYAGTAFFTLLIALGFIRIERMTKIKYLAYVLTAILLVCYISRVIARNKDWKTPETLAFATIKTSPLSVRPYNDVAGYYVMNNRTADAKKYYMKALTISQSIVAMNNLGYLYLMNDLDPEVRTLNIPLEDMIELSKQFVEQHQYRMAMYYLNEAYWQDQTNVSVLQGIGISYLENGHIDKADRYLMKAYRADPSNPDTVVLLGYAAYKANDIPKAKSYLEEVLKTHPDNKTAQDNLNYLNTLAN